jgi:hypothetical protein
MGIQFSPTTYFLVKDLHSEQPLAILVLCRGALTIRESFFDAISIKMK